VLEDLAHAGEVEHRLGNDRRELWLVAALDAIVAELVVVGRVVGDRAETPSSSNTLRLMQIVAPRRTSCARPAVRR
jgi:hypothetical protein